MSSSSRLATVGLFVTPAHRCGYLPGRDAVTLVVDPHAPLSARLYSRLAERGFRRSGELVYRPDCPDCQACIPCRVPADRFRPDRSQQRIWRANQDLTVRAAAGADAEHRALFRRYIAARHTGGSMDEPDADDPLTFLFSRWSDTVVYEFRLERQLLAGAAVDRLDHGLSAVYTYFDPEHARRGLGVYAVLWQISEARRLGLRWVYLGYWIEECAKMSYKNRYRPLEVLQQGRWREPGSGDAAGQA